jgi:hypothetical protein
MSGRDAVREVLYQHSDSRACRLVWAALDEDRPTPSDLEPADYLEVLRVTDESLSLVGASAEADRYVRWESEVGRFVHVTVWPPWGVVDAGAADRSAAASLLATAGDVHPVPIAETPFEDPALAPDLSGRL